MYFDFCLIIFLLIDLIYKSILYELLPPYQCPIESMHSFVDQFIGSLKSAQPLSMYDKLCDVLNILCYFFFLFLISFSSEIQIKTVQDRIGQAKHIWQLHFMDELFIFTLQNGIFFLLEFGLLF